MKKLILSALLFAGIAGAVSAQTTTGQGGNSTNQTKEKSTGKMKMAHSKTKTSGKNGTMHSKTKASSDSTSNQ